MKKIAMYGIVAIVAMGLAGCGSSSSATPTATTAASSANSLSDLPATSTLVAGSTSASLSVKSAGKAATGTPPLLKDISASNADTYFWNGLLATISSTNASAITEAQRTAYWQGEGACRMAQTVGYSFQNILQGGTSMCYMQNAPGAASGVTITSGNATAANIFDQGTASKVVKITTSNEEGGRSAEDVFIKVYGTGSTEGGSGYAADLWFCSSGSANGYEQIRVNSSAGTLTTTSVHSDFGNFVGTITGFLTTNASGQFIFDPSKDRGATVYFNGTFGDGSSTFLGNITINSAGLITARDYNNGTFGGQTNTNKHAVFANYTGDSMDTLRFSESSFALQDTFSSNHMTITAATEYSTTHYTDVASGTLLTTAQAERFDNNIYTGTSSTAYTTATAALSATSGFSCTTTPDVTVSMDFSQAGTQAVATLCENHFAEMNFCDGATVQAAREKIFASQTIQQGGGSCSTSFCAIGDDFSCQMWADDNPTNAQGLTTANAVCSNTGCCTHN